MINILAIKGHDRAITILLCFVLSFLLAPACAHAADWPQFHSDEYNSGVTTDTGPLSADGPYWDQYMGIGIPMSAGIDVAPIVGDGKAYVIAYNGSVYAYYLDNGSLAWKNKALGGQDAFIIGNPAYHDHVLYVSLQLGNLTADTGIHAIDTDDGSLIWSNTKLPRCQPITPIIYDDGMLYFGTWQGYAAYFGVDAGTGKTAWQRNSTTGEGYYWAGAAVIGDHIVFGDDAGHLTSLDKKTGEVADELDVSEEFGVDAKEIRSSVSYDENNSRIFFTSLGGYAYSLGFKNDTGEFDPSKKWNVFIDYSCSTPALYDGRLYVGSGAYSMEGKVYCLSEEDGSSIWNYAPDGGVQSSPTISVIDGKPYVYFTSNCANGSAYCLDETGNVVWKYTPPENKVQYMLCGVTISDGWALFGNDAGYLFAIGSKEGDGTATAIPSGSGGTTPTANGAEAGGFYLLTVLLALAIGAALGGRMRK